MTDFCPIYRVSVHTTIHYGYYTYTSSVQAFTYQTGQDTNCSNAANQPSTENNIRGETYGEGSRCIGQGREWNLVTGRFTYSSRLFGGGCYQAS